MFKGDEMRRYRIIQSEKYIDGWDVQKRVWFFFWMPVVEALSENGALTMLRQLKTRKPKY